MLIAKRAGFRYAIATPLLAVGEFYYHMIFHGKLMKAIWKTVALASICIVLSACGDKTTGKACLGSNSDSLVEGMQEQCEAGDAIATKHPAYFCDFNYAIAYNDYNSAFCIYSGKQKPERTIAE